MTATLRETPPNTRLNLAAPGYEEVVSKNMLVYQVPLSRFAETYNKQPLWYVALASEKSYLSLHLMSVYGDQAQVDRLKAGFRSAGKKLDMGKPVFISARQMISPWTWSGRRLRACPWIAGLPSRAGREVDRRVLPNKR